MTIGITGATGQLGRHVVLALKARIAPDELVALVRTPAKAADLGIAAREADYSRPETLDQALPGVDTVVLISASEVGQRVAQHHNVIVAARRAAVKRIIYTSLLHADRSPLGLATEHRATEEELQRSEIPFTILRNGWYSENYETAIRGALAAGALIGCAGAGKISSAARIDYAEAAAVVATGPGHEGTTYELAGDEAFTLGELAEEISRQASRTIPYADLQPAEYTAVLVAAGVPEPFAKVIAEYDVAASKGALFDDGHQLSTLIGRPTTPMKATVEAVLKRKG